MKIHGIDDTFVARTLCGESVYNVSVITYHNEHITCEGCLRLLKTDKESE